MKTLTDLLKEQDLKFTGFEKSINAIDYYILNPNLIAAKTTFAARIYRSCYNTVCNIYFGIDNSKTEDQIVFEAGTAALNIISAINKVEY